MGLCGSSEFINPDAIDLSHFEIMKVVGKGGFGKVNAITKKSSGELLALKRMEKFAVLQSQAHLNLVWVERKIMSITESPFLCNLLYAFQSPEELYLVMPFMQGGDLRYHLRENGILSEASVRFYAAELLCAIADLHEKKVIYRDLKPENILMDAEGHIRLSDYGLGCQLSAEKGYQISGQAGTRGYQAPEVLRNEYYGLHADVFSYGVTIYELLHGQRPWKENRIGHGGGNSEEDEEYINRMKDFPISSKLSSYCASFLRGLLAFDWQERLGCTPKNMNPRDGTFLPVEQYVDWNAMKNHSFFAEIDWPTLYAKKMKPPFTPDVSRANCFPSEDTRILTNKGFMFLDQLMLYAEPISPPLTAFDSSLSTSTIRYTLASDIAIAAYDPYTHRLTYAKECPLIVRTSQHETKLIEITPKDDIQQWADVNHQPSNCASIHLSIRVTEDHHLFVASADSNEKYTKVRASDVMSSDAHPSVRLLTRVAHGVDRNEAHLVEQQLHERLQLDIHRQVIIFLEVFGYFLSDGSIQSSQIGFNYVRINFKTDDEKEWLQQRLNQLSLDHRHEYTISSDTDRHYVSVTHPAWLRFFQLEAVTLLDESVILPGWTRQCGKTQLCAILNGIHRAAGVHSVANKSILTPSVTYRDLLLDLMVRAGYSAHFTAMTHSSQSLPLTHASLWLLTYTHTTFVSSAVPSVDLLHPRVDVARDMRYVLYPPNQSVFCVTVPTGLIVAQRAVRCPKSGVALAISRPLVIGNCSPDADLADQLLDDKPRPITQAQQQNFIGWDFNTELPKPLELVDPNPTTSTTSPTQTDGTLNKNGISSNQVKLEQ